MKLRVVGWVNNGEEVEQGKPGWAARHAIIDEIKKNGYLFSGWAHQEGYGLAPVLNDGKMYCYSQRVWGGIMAEAHGYTGKMDYAKFAFMMESEKEKKPEVNFDPETFVPETDLNEKFDLKVGKDTLDIAKAKGQIRLYDNPALRYLDGGDTLVLVGEEKKVEYVVETVDRAKDLTDEKRAELEAAMNDTENKEKAQLAEEEYKNAKTIMTIKFKV